MKASQQMYGTDDFQPEGVGLQKEIMTAMKSPIFFRGRSVVNDEF